ncbi:MAG TPA: protein translocase subunit SecF [Candidatus Paceibacterota bacterium]|nr:protein translocase subunit SecF [Candidatus Paceibacterota bacterium]
MFVIKHKKIFVAISIILVILSIISISVFGIKMGIDFKGGALTEVTYVGERPLQVDLNSELALLGLGSVVLQPTGESGYIVKTRDLTDDEHQALLSVMSAGDEYELVETSFNSIGPSTGRELSRKAITAIILSSFAVVCFIAFAFRKVSNPVSSWKYGLIAIAALLHDVIIAAGVFSLLSKFTGVEADSLFVVAALTIVGLSIADTIVVFDRIRENLRNEDNIKHHSKFEEIVGKSLDQSYARSILTSLTTILVLLSLFFFGPPATKYFAFMLTTGMIFGVYSSIFFASPVLVMWEEHKRKA